MGEQNETKKSKLIMSDLPPTYEDTQKYPDQFRNVLPGAYPVHTGYPFQPPPTQPVFHPPPPIETGIPFAGQNPEPPNHSNQPNYSSQGNYPRQPIDTTARQGPTPVFCHQAAARQNLNNSNNGIVNILRRRKRKVLIVIFVVLIVVILIPN